MTYQINCFKHCSVMYAQRCTSEQDIWNTWRAKQNVTMYKQKIMSSAYPCTCL